MNTSTIDEKARVQEAKVPALSILTLVWKRRRQALIIWIIGTAISIAVVKQLPPVYKAEAVVLVHSPNIPQSLVSPMSVGDVPDRLAELTQTIMTTARLTEIIRTFHLYKESRQASQEQVAARMRKDISVRFEKSWTGDQIHAFRLGYEGPDPEIAAEVANRLAGMYVAENSSARRHLAEGTMNFLQQRVEAVKASLDEQEQKLALFKKEHSGALPEQQVSLLGTLSSLTTELQGVQASIVQSQQNQSSTAAALSAAESSELAMTEYWRRTGDSPGSVAKLRSSRLKDELRTLRARFAPNYPDVKSLERELAEVEREESGESGTANAAAYGTPNRSRTNVSTQPRTAVVPPELVQARERVTVLRAQSETARRQSESLEAERKRLADAIQECKAMIGKLPVVEQEMAGLKRGYEESAANYKSLLQKQLSAAIATDMERSQQSERFTLIEPAHAPDQPEKPRRGLLAIIASFGSLALGLFVAFARGFQEQKIIGEWELPAGVIVLGRIPVIIPVTSFMKSERLIREDEGVRAR